MKVAVVSSHVRWVTHFGTDLEIMQQHLNDGDEVIHLVCNGEMLPCDQNMHGSKDICCNCVHKRIVGTSILSGKVETIPMSLGNVIKHTSALASVERLKSYQYKGFDVGYAALSSLISSVRRTEFNAQDIAMLGELVNKGCAMFDFIYAFLKEREPDRVYIFNGRFLYPRAVLRACQMRGIKVFVHERGHSVRHYELYEDTLPHDLTYIQSKIVEHWDSSRLSENERERIGAVFFADRRNGKQQAWFSFTREQNKELLPEGWDYRKRNFVIFNSSEDEFASIGDDWKKFVFSSQTDGIIDMVTRFASDQTIQFYLRMHPNLAKVKNKDVDRLLSLDFPNLRIISANSNVSTYATLDAAEKVITFGSTMGIEAVYWGKPSIVLGSCFYRHLGSTYNPEDKQSFYRLITKTLEPLPKRGAIMYGYYLNTFGREFKLYDARGLFHGSFKGKDLVYLGRMPWALWILRKLPLRRVPSWLLGKLY